MIIDLTDRRIISEHGLVATQWGDFPSSEWRHLLLAPKQTAIPVVDQVRALLAAHLNDESLALLQCWPAFRSTSAEHWRGFAANALTYGLAYGPTSTRIDNRPENVCGVTRLIDRLLEAFDGPEFCSNWALPDSRWLPVSEHTFDACLIVHDRNMIGVVIVADED